MMANSAEVMTGNKQITNKQITSKARLFSNFMSYFHKFQSFGNI
jgi:hypothetical protein